MSKNAGDDMKEHCKQEDDESLNMISPADIDILNGLPPAFGGCTCGCHYTEGVVHCVPCCYPSDDDNPELLLTPESAKMDLSKELRDRTFASHIILTGITYAADKSIVKKLAVDNHDDGGIEVSLVVNGYELNFQQFAINMKNSIDDMVREKAKEMALEMTVGKFDDLTELADDLAGRLKEEINKRLEDWEDPL